MTQFPMQYRSWTQKHKSEGTIPSLPQHITSLFALYKTEIHEKLKDWNQFLLAFSEVATAKRGDGIWCYQLYNTVVLVLVLWTLRYTTRSALYHWQETLKVYYQQRHQTHTLMGQHLQHQAQIFISSIAWWCVCFKIQHVFM